MAGPNLIQIKRKRDETGPETLVVERQVKRAFTDEHASELQKLHYVRQNAVSYNDEQRKQDTVTQERLRQQPNEVGVVDEKPKSAGPGHHESRRIFYLARPRDLLGASHGQSKSNVATFVETQGPTSTVNGKHTTNSSARTGPSDATRFKRPGKGAAVPSRDRRKDEVKATDGRDRERMESLADDMHQFAMEEMSCESKPSTPASSVPERYPRDMKPKVTAIPKLAGARSRELHRQRMPPTESRIQDREANGEDDMDYVYDTYILAPSASVSGSGNLNVSPAGHDSKGDIGYLIITEEDRSIWEAFIDDESSDNDGDTDDEDENAEDYYGADYPEDDLASDDEHGRNAYGYRPRGASDDEEWDEDTGIYSDEDENDGLASSWKNKMPKLHEPNATQ